MMRLCCQPAAAVKPLRFKDNVSPERRAAIATVSKLWMNGSTLRYAFLGGTSSQHLNFNLAASLWEETGMGLILTPARQNERAQIRVAFQRGQGSWSYVGRDNLGIPANQPTMNLGWEYDGNTYEHEIGHALGLEHSHQNPQAGIKWNTGAVYRSLSGPPNNWTRAMIQRNVLNKLDMNAIQGSVWDPNSVMQYPFASGLIIDPALYRNGLNPEPGLSPIDKQVITELYPARPSPDEPDNLDLEIEPADYELVGFEPGEQVDFKVKIDQDGTYRFATIGEIDTVMILSKHDDVGLKTVLAGDDNSGLENDATFDVELNTNDSYVLSARLAWWGRKGKSYITMSPRF